MSQQDRNGSAAAALVKAKTPRKHGGRNVFQSVANWLCPLLWAHWWYRVYREVLLEKDRTNLLLRASRTANLVFLLDSESFLVWPNPRPLSKHPTFAEVVAHLILRARNPALEIRERPGRSSKSAKENLAELNREWAFRYSMFMAYGDQWPSDLAVVPASTFTPSKAPQSSTCDPSAPPQPLASACAPNAPGRSCETRFESPRRNAGSEPSSSNPVSNESCAD